MLLTVACVASALLLAASRGLADLDHSSLGNGQRSEDAVQSSFRITDDSRQLLIVSTLDGCITALDALSGTEQWSLSTGTTPLLSSSISKLQIMRGGKLVHLVPSLDGGLYQFDGDGIEPVPLGADLLMSSSLRFTDDSTIVGGKDIETYGIDIKTGKVRYVCSAVGCKYFDGCAGNLDGRQFQDDVLVVKRTTKTVRAVELQTGSEKWNFSVGQNEIAYITQKPTAAFDLVQDTKQSEDNGGRVAHPSVADENSSSELTGVIMRCNYEKDACYAKVKDTMEESCEDCDVHMEETDDGLWSEMLEVDSSDLNVRVVVQSGQVVVTDRINPNIFHWQRRFTSAVAGAWMLHGKELSKLSLLDGHSFPVSEEDSCNNVKSLADNGNLAETFMYIGTFEGQIYVQPLTRGVSGGNSVAVIGGSVNANVPQIRWRPYIATAPSRTPSASTPRNRLQVETGSNALSLAVLQWYEQYPFDEGFFLFPDYRPIEPMHLISAGKNETVLIRDQGHSFKSWSTFIVMTTVLSVLINVFVFMCLFKRHRRSATLPETSTPESVSRVIIEIDEDKQLPASSSEEITDSKPVTSIEMYRAPEYVSRYVTDFTQESCLGRGGFGVVFCARNRLDDCVYAVKRIALNDSTRAREKVTREVKALAKLDHPGIVRYYQSWFENPPPGWQEDRDKMLFDSSAATPTGLADFTPSIENKLPTNAFTDKKTKLKPIESDADSSLNNYKTVSDSSELITSRFHASLNRKSPQRFHNAKKAKSSLAADSGTENDSFEISFREDESAASDSTGHAGPDSIPVTNSVEDSFEISFRDEEKSAASDSTGELCDSVTTTDSDEESFGIIFEGSAIMEDRYVGSVKDEKDLLRPKIAKPCRPKVLELKQSGTRGSNNLRNARGPLVSKLYLFIQMQLCQRENLKDWLNNNTLNRDKRLLLDVFYQITSAINYVHSSGMMHRDLKPSNIFFAMDGAIKIGDFGLVTAVEETCVEDVLSADSQRASGNRMHTDQVGTKLYMSPEQQSSARNYTHKVDIYALGMIFFELFYPFATEMERINTLLDVRQMKFPARFIRELHDEAEFVRPLLSHEAELRPGANQILKHSIVRDFEEASQAYQRLHSQSRFRTMSTSSGSNSTSEPSLANMAA